MDELQIKFAHHGRSRVPEARLGDLRGEERPSRPPSLPNPPIPRPSPRRTPLSASPTQPAVRVQAVRRHAPPGSGARGRDGGAKRALILPIRELRLDDASCPRVIWLGRLDRMLRAGRTRFLSGLRAFVANSALCLTFLFASFYRCRRSDGTHFMRQSEGHAFMADASSFTQTVGLTRLLPH